MMMSVETLFELRNAKTTTSTKSALKKNKTTTKEAATAAAPFLTIWNDSRSVKSKQINDLNHYNANKNPMNSAFQGKK